MTPRPFRTFFPLAGLDAILVVAMWPVMLLAEGAMPISRLRFIEWHASELLFGYVPAVLAGFVLTALPRWTAAPLVPPAPMSFLVSLWVAGRAAGLVAVMTGFEWTVWLEPLFPIAIAAIASRHIVVTRNRRNEKVAVLLWLFALGSVIEALHWGGSASEVLGERMAIAAAIGLVMVLGGRIAPSFTDAIIAARANASSVMRSRAIEIPAAGLAGGGLVAWVCAPGGQTAAILCAAAALVQSLRLAQWRGLSVIDAPNVCVFHAAYAFVPLGFALVAAHWLSLPTLAAAASIHAWTVGAIGLMSLAVMTSMVRRQTGHALEISRAATGAYVLCGTAGICRVAAAVSGSASDILLVAAAISWIGAFGLFLVLMRSMLCRAGPPSRTVATSGERSMGAENRPSHGNQAQH